MPGRPPGDLRPVSGRLLGWVRAYFRHSGPDGPPVPSPCPLGPFETAPWTRPRPCPRRAPTLFSPSLDVEDDAGVGAELQLRPGRAGGGPPQEPLSS